MISCLFLFVCFCFFSGIDVSVTLNLHVCERAAWCLWHCWHIHCTKVFLINYCITAFVHADTMVTRYHWLATQLEIIVWFSNVPMKPDHWLRPVCSQCLGMLLVSKKREVLLISGSCLVNFSPLLRTNLMQLLKSEYLGQVMQWMIFSGWCTVLGFHHM